MVGAVTLVRSVATLGSVRGLAVATEKMKVTFTMIMAKLYQILSDDINLRMLMLSRASMKCVLVQDLALER